MTRVEHLTESDFAEGGEAYIRYCSGITIMQHPYKMTAVHNQPDIYNNPEGIVVTAKEMMISSIRRIIRVAQPPEYRVKLVARSNKKSFEIAEPAMREIVEYACDRHEDRLDKLNDMFTLMRPAPFLQLGAYINITHGNHARLPLLELMDGFMPDDALLSSIR